MPPNTDNMYGGVGIANAAQRNDGGIANAAEHGDMDTAAALQMPPNIDTDTDYTG